MAAIDWDEDEDITRDRRWPPGMSFRHLTEPRIRIMGPPALGFVPGAGPLGRANRGEPGRSPSRRALPLPGSAKPRNLRARLHRTASFFAQETNRPTGQQVDLAPPTVIVQGLSAPAPSGRSLADEQPDPSIQLGFAELYDVFDLADDDDTEAMRRAIAVAVVDATQSHEAPVETEAGVGAAEEPDDEDWMGFEPVSLEPVTLEPEPPPDGDSFALEPMGFEPVWAEPAAAATLEEPVQEQVPERNQPSPEVVELESAELESVVEEVIALEPAELESVAEEVIELAPEEIESVMLDATPVEPAEIESVLIDLAELESEADESVATDASELPQDELASKRLEVDEPDWEDLETVKLAPAVIEQALESMAIGLTRRTARQPDGAPPPVDSAAVTNPFLIESSSSLVWPPASLATSLAADLATDLATDLAADLAAEPETGPATDPEVRRGANTMAADLPADRQPSPVEDDGPALPRKTPVLEMAFDQPPSEPGEPPPASAERLVEGAPIPAPELPSRPGSIVPVDELDEAPPVLQAFATMAELAQAADAAPSAPGHRPAGHTKAAASPPPPPVRRQQGTTAAWPPPLPEDGPDPGPRRTGLTLAGLCPKSPVEEAPLLADEDVPPPTSKVMDSEPPPAAVADEPSAPAPSAPAPSAPALFPSAATVTTPEPAVIVNALALPAEPEVCRPEPAFDRGLVGLRPSAQAEPPARPPAVALRPAVDRPSETPAAPPLSNITRERRRAERKEEEQHRRSLGYESTMPYSWVTVPALESAPSLPLVVKPSAASLAPTALPELPSLPRGSWRSVTQWLAVAATVVAMALLTWQLLPREGSLRIVLSEPITAAAVYVDGAKKCDVVPCEVADVRPGARVITVIAPGFERSQTVASALPGELIEVTLPLEAVPPPPKPTVQGLRATSQQRGVEVFVDGKRRGELPLELKDLTPGQHTVLFSAGDRYAALEQVVDIGADTIADLGSIELTLLRGLLTLEVRTPHSRVLLGTKGKRSSQKDVRGPWPKTIELEPGHYDVIGAKEGCLPVAYSVAVDAKHPEPHVVIELEPDPYYYTPY